MTFLVWIVLGFCGAYIGYSKGYSPQWMGLFGLFLGPFFLVAAYLFLPKTGDARARDLEDRRISDEQKAFARTQSCPACQKEITSQAWVCGYCGHQFVKMT